MIYRKSTTIILLLIGLLSGFMGLSLAEAAPIGTAITYQGRLDDGGLPANGSYDFEFSLYDDLNAGAQVGSTLAQTLPVTDGIFDTLLDFGAGIFTGDARFLEIAVQMTGGGGYTTLTPRQRLTVVPNASYAHKVQGIENVVMVAKSGGDHTTLGAALASVTTANVSNPFLIRVGPGIYEETVVLKSFVSIEGSGEGVTILRGPGGESFDGTLKSSGAVVAEVRLMTIESVSTGSRAIGINVVNGGDTLKLTHVTVFASGGSADTYAMYNYNSSPALSGVTLKAMGGTNTRGIFNNLNSSPTLFNVSLDASGGTNNAAVYNGVNSSPRLTNVIGTAGAGSSSAGLVNSNGANPILRDSEFEGVTYDIYNDGTSSVEELGNGLVDQPTLNFILGSLPRVAFITSTSYTGDLVTAASGLPGPPTTGLLAADAICQSHADAASLPGIYKAWLSDSTGSPSTRFVQSPSKYLRTDGEIVASGWTDLTDGILMNAINRDEFGNDLNGANAWTGTATNGTFSVGGSGTGSCDNWTDGSVGDSALEGIASQSNLNGDWTARSSSFACSSVLNLYCFQQETGGVGTAVGPQGEQGIPGLQGIQGVQGLQGVQGQQGPVGPLVSGIHMGRCTLTSGDGSYPPTSCFPVESPAQCGGAPFNETCECAAGWGLRVTGTCTGEICQASGIGFGSPLGYAVFYTCQKN